MKKVLQHESGVGRARIALISLVLISFALRPAAASVSLAGSWGFQLDRQDAGIGERWFIRQLDQRIHLPGALQNEGFGDEITVDTPWTGVSNPGTWLNGPQYEEYRHPGNIKVPFCLQPERHYVGVAWYQRQIQIPKDWKGKRVFLTLERPHWETRVWVDSQEFGTNASLSTPHVYDLGTKLAPGRTRSLFAWTTE